ncbi:MAG: hypothetical protein H0W70_10395 [Actinobacteria bacterium]|nr:hypothetical protein [Actinomycetota bacterium]
MTTTPTSTQDDTRILYNKVPLVTLFFWVIKIMATTVGETAADWLIQHTSLTLVSTLWLSVAVLGVMLLFQFRAHRYVPVWYWSTVVVISIVGTLITDYLTDVMGLSLWVSSAAFTALLAVVFAVWHRQERTLSIHSIVTPKREAFYWLAILCTFALGTAAGDLLAEKVNLGYLTSGLLFGVAIAAVAVAWRVLEVSAVLTFWIAYILTRPMGASIGDYLSQPHKHGGLALGTTRTSEIFLAAILVLVVYLTVSKRDIDVVEVEPAP